MRFNFFLLSGGWSHKSRLFLQKKKKTEHLANIVFFKTALNAFDLRFTIVYSQRTKTEQVVNLILYTCSKKKKKNDALP